MDINGGISNVIDFLIQIENALAAFVIYALILKAEQYLAALADSKVWKAIRGFMPEVLGCLSAWAIPAGTFGVGLGTPKQPDSLKLTVGLIIIVGVARGYLAERMYRVLTKQGVAAAIKAKLVPNKGDQP